MMRALAWALLLLGLACCAGEAKPKLSLPSHVAHQLPLVDLASQALEDSADWGRTRSQPRIVETEEGQTYYVEGHCPFELSSVAREQVTEAFAERMRVLLHDELTKRGALDVEVHALAQGKLNGSSVEADYAGDHELVGSIHVEVRGQAQGALELFFVISESAAC